MVKRAPVKMRISKDLVVTTNRVTVKSNDSSPAAIAALKAIFKSPEEKKAKILDGALKIATPLIKREKKSVKDAKEAGEKSGTTRRAKQAEWDARVLLTINKLTDEYEKDLKKPTSKDIAKRHKDDFNGEIATRQRIERLRQLSK